jgi:hypothetical protein
MQINVIQPSLGQDHRFRNTGIEKAVADMADHNEHVLNVIQGFRQILWNALNRKKWM